MELRYPYVISVVFLFVLAYFMLIKKKDTKYKKGSKIANTEYLRNTNYFKKKLREYSLIKKVFGIVFIIGIISSTILISRLAEVNTHIVEEYNRDIFLCMDVSTSVDALNLELMDSLQDVVSKLDGERFGISIFNTSSITVVPLTEDYDYVNNILETMKTSIKTSNHDGGLSYGDDYYAYIRDFISTGTIEGVLERGSSLIGDGLATCVYSFSNLEEKRSRSIIFSTDNDLAGDPLVTLEQAAKISKSKNIKVFGIGTKNIDKDYRVEFKNAVELTEGKYYDQSSATVDDIVSDIEKTTKTVLKNKVETSEIDIPKVPFIILMISVVGIIIISKKV